MPIQDVPYLHLPLCLDDKEENGNRKLMRRMRNQVSDQGYSFVKLSGGDIQFRHARQDLIKRMSDYHSWLDIHSDPKVFPQARVQKERLNGIGKVDFLPRSCLKLHIQSGIVSIFTHILQCNEEDMVSKLDVPQLVPPGQTQPYVGYNAPNYPIAGVLTLTDQLVTKDRLRVPSGTLILYNREKISQDFFRPNPSCAVTPWIGLRISFFRKDRDPLQLDRSKLFYGGHLGIHYPRSGVFKESDILRDMKHFIKHNSRKMHFFAPNDGEETQAIAPFPCQWILSGDGSVKPPSVHGSNSGRQSSDHTPTSHQNETNDDMLPKRMNVCRQTTNPVSSLPDDDTSELPTIHFQPKRLLKKRSIDMHNDNGYGKQQKLDEKPNNSRVEPMKNRKKTYQKKNVIEKKRKFHQSSNKDILGNIISSMDNMTCVQDTCHEDKENRDPNLCVNDILMEMTEFPVQPLSPLPLEIHGEVFGADNNMPYSLKPIDRDQLSNARTVYDTMGQHQSATPSTHGEPMYEDCRTGVLHGEVENTDNCSGTPDKQSCTESLNILQSITGDVDDVAQQSSSSSPPHQPNKDVHQKSAKEMIDELYEKDRIEAARHASHSMAKKQDLPKLKDHISEIPKGERTIEISIPHYIRDITLYRRCNCDGYEKRHNLSKKIIVFKHGNLKAKRCFVRSKSHRIVHEIRGADTVFDVLCAYGTAHHIDFGDIHKVHRKTKENAVFRILMDPTLTLTEQEFVDSDIEQNRMYTVVTDPKSIVEHSSEEHVWYDPKEKVKMCSNKARVNMILDEVLKPNKSVQDMMAEETAVSGNKTYKVLPFQLQLLHDIWTAYENRVLDKNQCGVVDKSKIYMLLHVGLNATHNTIIQAMISNKPVAFDQEQVGHAMEALRYMDRKETFGSTVVHDYLVQHGMDCGDVLVKLALHSPHDILKKLWEIMLLK